jgi:predicted  nucleic acid-binding Zn-ribbon protein
MARGDSLQRTAEPLSRDLQRIRESIEKLTGERGDATKSQSAVRRSELRVLASLSLQSKQVAAAPTQADFNALQSDVDNIFKTLQRISNILGNATLPKA